MAPSQFSTMSSINMHSFEQTFNSLRAVLYINSSGLVTPCIEDIIKDEKYSLNPAVTNTFSRDGQASDTTASLYFLLNSGINSKASLKKTYFL